MIIERRYKNNMRKGMEIFNISLHGGAYIKLLRWDNEVADARMCTTAPIEGSVRIRYAPRKQNYAHTFQEWVGMIKFTAWMHGVKKVEGSVEMEAETHQRRDEVQVARD